MNESRDWRHLGTVLRLGLFGGLSAFWLSVVPFGNDALLYRGAATRLVQGDPWSVSLGDFSYAAPPLEAVPFLPFAALSDAGFLAVWLPLSAFAVIWIVHRLDLDATYVLFPPLVLGAALGNPAVVGMALVLAGAPIAGLVFRPQLALVGSRRAVVVLAIASFGAILLRPDYVTAVVDVAQRYGSESLAINFWGTPLMVPAAVSLLLLARIDRPTAAWLAMPAIGPAMGWYGLAMVLPVRSRALAFACALPIPYLGAAAITAYCCARVIGLGHVELAAPRRPLRVAGTLAQYARLSRLGARFVGE
jgi:hypothetical protein